MKQRIIKKSQEDKMFDYFDQLKKLRLECEECGVPLLRPISCEILKSTVAIKSPKNILEIGTGIGYSSIAMLLYCNATLTTIEKDEGRCKKACENFDKFNLSSRVNIINEDALSVIENIKEKFDFIFLDGPKAQYIKYLPILKKLLNKDGVLFADNVLFQNLVLGDEIAPQKHRTIVTNLRKYLNCVCNDEDFHTFLIEVEDGICISYKR